MLARKKGQMRSHIPEMSFQAPGAKWLALPVRMFSFLGFCHSFSWGVKKELAQADSMLPDEQLKDYSFL